VLVLAVVACGAVLASTPGYQVAGASTLSSSGCSNFDVTGTWTTYQSNNYTVTWHFQQNGTTVSGSATLPEAEAQASGLTGTVGTVSGTVKGDRLDVTVQWPKKTDGSTLRGEYVGTIEQGTAANMGSVSDGEAWNVATPSLKATWTGHGAAMCSEEFKFLLTYSGDPLAGHGEGQDLGQLTGTVADTGCVPYRCAGCAAAPCSKPPITVPAIQMKVTRASLDVEPLTVKPPDVTRWQPPMERILTLTVTVTASPSPGECAIGDTGTIRLTDRDLETSTGVNGSRFEIGGWHTPCKGHTYVLDGTSPGAVGAGTGLSPGKFYVYVWIACPGHGPGISPHNCH
jgi:hypothetical protein